MGRQGISYQDVANAAATLQGKGQTVTVDHLREVLGTGSKSTLARHLKAWKSQQPTDHPHGLPADLFHLVQGLWKHLQEEAQLEILKCKEETTASLKEKDDVCQTLQEKLHNETTQVAQLMSSLQDTEKTNQSLQQQIHTSQTDNLLLKDRNTTLDQQLADYVQEQTKLHDLLNHMQKNLAHYQEAIQQLKVEQDLKIEEQRQQYDHKISILEHTSRKQVEDNIGLSTQLETNKTQINELTKKNIEITQALEKSQQTVLETQVLNKQHQARHQELTTQHQVACNKIDEIIEKNGQIQAQLAVTHEQNLALASDVTRLTEELGLLNQKYLIALQEKAHLEGKIEAMSQR